MTRKILTALLPAVFVFSLMSVLALAYDRQPLPATAPVQSGHHLSTPMTVQDAQPSQRSNDGRAYLAETLEATPNFVSGTVAVQSALGPTGKFCGIFAGNTCLEAQHDGTCQRMIQTGVDSSGPHPTLKRYIHVTWMVLKEQDIPHLAAFGDQIASTPQPDTAHPWPPPPPPPLPSQVNYNCYRWHGTSGWDCYSDDYGGLTVTPPGERGGYTTLDVNSEGNAVVAWHRALEGGWPYTSVSMFSIPGLCVYFSDFLAHPPGTHCIWPRVSVGTCPNDVYHVVARDSDMDSDQPAIQCYWRYLTATSTWQGPVVMDSTLIPGYLLLANGGRVVFVLAKPRTYGTGRNAFNNDLAYYNSTDCGATWIVSGGPLPDWQDGGAFNCTEYKDSDPHRCFMALAGDFDSQGRLHLLYVSQGYDASTGAVSAGPCELLHWDEGTPGSNENASVSGQPPDGFVGGQEQYFSTVARAMWGAPGYGTGCAGKAGVGNLYISHPSLAFGDGSTTCNGSPNLDYLYATYTQFGSEDPLDKEDASAAGYQNGNIWLSISNDLGNSWDAQRCMTTTDCIVGGTPTRSPDCDFANNDTCRSENWSSSASLVNDTLHVFYIGDLEAGDAKYDEGDWTVNDAMYLPIFGGTDGPLCPPIAPILGVALTGDPNCEYFSDLGKPFSSETLTISNFGNTTLNYGAKRVYINGTGWLALNGGDTITATSIVKAGSPNAYTVDMDGSALPNGLYQAYIRIWHNDPARYNPDTTTATINFFRADSFICGAGIVVHTPCVALEVSNVESWGRENGNGGMRYYAEPDNDSLFNPFRDGSLLIANKDSTKPAPGDTIVYRDIFSNQTRSNPGFRGLEYLKLSYNAATNESVATANQVTNDSTIGVSVKYLFPQDADKCEFVRVKFKVYHTKYRNTGPLHLIIGAGSDIDAPGGDAQGIGSENVGGVIPKYNMVYQHGTDTVRTGGFHRETNKFVAGMTAITCTPVNRLKIGSNRNDVYPANGFTDGYIFRALNGTGNQVWADSADDIHSIMSIKDITLNDQKAYVYQIGLVTSLAGQTGVKADAANYKAPYEGYVANLMSTAGKAWKKGFGWCGDFWMTGGHLNLVGTTDSITFTATGTHENGLDGGCCGCNFTIVSIVPTPTSGTPVIHNFGDCTGSLVFNNTKPDNTSYTVTLRVADLCGAQTDEVTFVAHVPSECNCGRTTTPIMWADLSCDGAINPVDVVRIVRCVYQNRCEWLCYPPGWNCPRTLGDVDWGGSLNPVDVVIYVNCVYKSNCSGICSNPCLSLTCH